METFLAISIYSTIETFPTIGISLIIIQTFSTIDFFQPLEHFKLLMFFQSLEHFHILIFFIYWYFFSYWNIFNN
jgi:hypothetical protein